MQSCSKPPRGWTWQEYAEAGHRRADEFQRVNGELNTELDSLREQLATAKAGLRNAQQLLILLGESVCL